MAKVAKKKQSSSLTRYVIVLVSIGAVAFALTGSDPKKPTKPIVKRSRGLLQQQDEYTDADRTAKFALLNESAKDSFRPLVVRTGPGGVSVRGDGKGIPIGLAGDAGWIYSGMATVDGVPNALIENSNSGEGVFLKPGDHWRHLEVLTMTPNEIIIRGPDGEALTVRVEDDSNDKTDTQDETVEPVKPSLRGPIGDVSVQPNPGAAAPSVPGITQGATGAGGDQNAQ